MKIDDLAKSAGVSPRTVRYYIQRGLVPAPEFHGADTGYGERHLLALRAVKRLQEAYWPLDAIASALAAISLDELRRIAQGEHVPAATRIDVGTPEPANAEPSFSVSTARGERIALAQGLELWVDDRAPEKSRRLADEIRNLIQMHHDKSQNEKRGRKKGKDGSSS